MDKFILNFTPTGMIPTKSMTPNVPLTPEEIISQVLEAAELGVNMVHLHARDHDTGEPTYKKEMYGEIISGIRKHNKNPKKVEEVMQFVRENGGLEYATTRMNEYKDKALSLLDEFDDNEARVSLKKMIIYITERKK